MANLTASDYVNYANAMAQMLAMRDRVFHPDTKERCSRVAYHILDILDPVKPKATVLELVHKKESDNA
jgi:hypothetical protein